MASILPFLNREDRTLVACYRSIYAPRTGGAYDSHHRTAGIAGRTRRYGSGVAGRGGCAAMACRSTANAMKGITEWLASIGLSEYAQRFADNAIDLSVIRDLTEQDLKAFCWGTAAGFCARSRSLMGALLHLLKQRLNRRCATGPNAVTSP